MNPQRYAATANRQYLISFHGTKFSVTATKRGAEVNEWINKVMYNHRHRLDSVVVGLDIEWLPCKPGEDNPTATLQICVGHCCLIFQLLHRDSVPVSLLAFLSHRRFTFVGVGVQDDANKLLRLVASVCGSTEFLRIGLKKMAVSVLRMEMEKPLSVTLSDWDVEELSFPQIEYGAIDAFVSPDWDCPVR